VINGGFHSVPRYFSFFCTVVLLYFRFCVTSLIVNYHYRMVEIMNKARIKYDNLKMVDDSSIDPKEETQSLFDRLISDFHTNDISDSSERFN